MVALREYILGIAAAAMICAITLGFAGKGTMKPLLKLICGLVLTAAALKPVLAFSSGELDFLTEDYRLQAEQTAEAGEEMAAKSLAAIIRENTESYILEKAKQIGLDIEAEVELGNGVPPIPRSVRIRGEIPPYQKTMLSWILREDLGIREEDQLWER